MTPPDSAGLAHWPEPGGTSRNPTELSWREPPTVRSVNVDEVRVAYRVWEPEKVGAPATDSPTVLLIHGNAARSEWWDAIAPSLTPRARVIALDLSGHGRSAWRSAYTFGCWIQEVQAVLDSEDAKSEVTVVGHSMGGLVALCAAWAEPERFSGVVLLDTPLRRFSEEQLAKRVAIAARPLPRHCSLDEAVAQFTTTPRLRRQDEQVLAHVARNSYRQEAGEWVLHFDPALYTRVTDVDQFHRPFPAQTFLVRAEYGLITDRMLDEMLPCLQGQDRLETVPGVSHNFLLEAPGTTAELIMRLMERIEAQACDVSFRSSVAHRHSPGGAMNASIFPSRIAPGEGGRL